VNGEPFKSVAPGVTGLTANSTNLINGSTYQFRIASGYTIGDKVTYGDYIQISATPRGAPDAPTALVATQTGATTATFSWTPPTNNGGSAITSYEVDRCIACGTLTFSLSAEGPTINLTGLTGGVGNGNRYTLFVRTVTALGTSTHVTVELPMIALIGVSDLQGTAAETSMALTWDAPPTNGTTYMVSYKTSDSEEWLVVTSGLTDKSYTVSALTALTAYDFKVEATTAAGTGVAATLTKSTL
jgi:hypothetical protein